jgi:hypothetical protein
MHSDHYVHPEFGLLAPTSRLKRELRIGFFSLLLGIAIGVVALNSMRPVERSEDGLVASPVVAEGPVTALPIASPPRIAEHGVAGNWSVDASSVGGRSGTDPGKAQVGCDGDRFGCATGLSRHAVENEPTLDQSAVASVPIDQPASTTPYPGGRLVDLKVEPFRDSVASASALDAGQNLPSQARLPSSRKA